MMNEKIKNIPAEKFVFAQKDKRIHDTQLETKAIDVVWNGMTLTEEVKKLMGTAEPYCNNGQVVVVKSDVAVNVKIPELYARPASSRNRFFRSSSSSVISSYQRGREF